jgi:acyl carrier protein
MRFRNNPLMHCEDIREMRREVRDCLASSFYVPERLADSASLLETGIAGSLAELVAFVESNFGVTIRREEALPENLDSIARVARFVCGKKACAASAPAEEIEDEAIDELGMGDRRHVPEAVELDPLDIG